MGHCMYLVNVNFCFCDFPCINADYDQTKSRLCYFSVLANVSRDLFFNMVKLSHIFMEKLVKCPWFPEGNKDTLCQAPWLGIIASIQRDPAHSWVFSPSSRENYKLQQPFRLLTWRTNFSSLLIWAKYFFLFFFLALLILWWTEMGRDLELQRDV